MGKCLRGPVDDTGELLRGVRATSRESYFNKSASTYVFYAVLAILFLAIAVTGVFVGGVLGLTFALCGSLGIVLVSIWLGLR